MRLRNIPGSREMIAENQWCIQTPETHKGHWPLVFGNGHPLFLEIGMGKGQFLHTLAKENPMNNYIGIEKYSSVLLRALEKMELEPLSNLRFLCVDAEAIPDFFATGEVAGIYLNFSDPWPKDRHAKRRLTSKEFLARYQKVLAPQGHVEFKTDNVPLFDFSLEQVELAGWKLIASTRDLHQDPLLNQGNIMTEYEERFSSMGNPICKLIIAMN